MPFTFAHPSIVLPLIAKKTKYLDLTALVIGTMSPDFEYFIHFKPVQIVGHTLLGQVYFNLPIVFIVAFIYHYILKEPVILNLPKPYCDRYDFMIKRCWKIDSISKLFVFCYSAIIGAYTHIFWDGFTHETGYFVNKIRPLSEHIKIVGFKIPVYKMLQHGSTLMGFVAIIIYLVAIQDDSICIRNQHKISNFHKLKFWSGIILIGILISGFIILRSDSIVLGGVIVTVMDGIFIGFIMMSIMTRIQLLNTAC